jgi:hypothetical protein
MKRIARQEFTITCNNGVWNNGECHCPGGEMAFAMLITAEDSDCAI